jgi:predicted nucleic-acid-binding protein
MIAEQQGKTLYIPDITFTELFFVLERSPRYLMKRQAVCAALRDLLRSSRFSYSKEADQAFLIAERLPKLDFTDCLLAVYAEDTNQLLTLDKELQKLLATSKG